MTEWDKMQAHQIYNDFDADLFNRRVAAKVAALPREKTTSVRTALVYDGTLEPCVKATRAYDFLIPSEELLMLS